MTADRFLRARFQSLCPSCKALIVTGDAITTERGGKARHWTCSPGPDLPPTPQPAQSPWSRYRGQRITVRRGPYEVTGKLLHLPRYDDRTGAALPDRWYLSVSHGGYERSTYTRSFDLRDGDVFVGVVS